MQKLSKVVIGAGILALIVLAGALLGWLGSRATSPPGQTQPPVVAAKTNPHPLTATQPPPGNQVPATNPAVPEMAEAESFASLTNWEDKLDFIIGSDDEDTNKVKQLFALFPTLPEDGKEEAAIHLSNLISDEDYAPLAELLKDATLPEAVLDTLMADVLNRPNSLKMPLFLELARNPQHPNSEESRDLLELYLEEDYGTDWNKWGEKLQEWLKENPD
jgi:hypothetical protein